MPLYESLLRPLAFRLDPERVHEIGLRSIALGLVKAEAVHDARLEQDLFGVRFPNPLGLAAGFDKNAVALDQWGRLGFGFVEVGTVTLLAQPGNPKPRMFRVPEHRGIINRLGSNNGGAEAAARRIGRSQPEIPYGINLGKSKVTPLEMAASDYQSSFRLLRQYGAYFVVNVSSPNTPGLRSLQEKGPLLEILQALREVDSEKPLFVKVAPDLSPSALDEVVDVAHTARLTGLIATNTTIARDTLPRDPGIEGGLSGEPLKRKADGVLAHLARACDPSIILIGVGGIATGLDVYDKIRLGAHLCQLYTGFVYRGPQAAPSILSELLDLVERDGVNSLDELRGTALR